MYSHTNKYPGLLTSVICAFLSVSTAKLFAVWQAITFLASAVGATTG